MSRRRRRRRSAEQVNRVFDRYPVDLDRSGGSYWYPSAPALPRTQERIHRSIALADESSIALRFSPNGRKRSFDFLPYRLAEVHYGPKTLRSVGSARRHSFLDLNRLYTRLPSRVKYCVDRKERREVLFALGRAGFSGSAPGRYKRTVESSYTC